MTVVLGDLEFDNVVYDGGADVLYLHVGDPASAVDALRYDAGGHLVGVTIVNARWQLEQGEQVTITLPKPIQVDRNALAAAIGPGG